MGGIKRPYKRKSLSLVFVARGFDDVEAGREKKSRCLGGGSSRCSILTYTRLQLAVLEGTRSRQEDGEIGCGHILQIRDARRWWPRVGASGRRDRVTCKRWGRGGEKKELRGWEEELPRNKLEFEFRDFR
jgi:hypothetical protein